MRLALFGGTFDPIHDAHLAVARAATDFWNLDRVWFIPAARPPHKAGFTHAPYEDRVRMIELACGGEPGFEASRIEEGTERSYSIDTIENVRAAMPAGTGIFFLIGADAFAEIRTWRRWREVITLVEFIVVSRPGHGYDAPEGTRVHRLDGLDLRISSTEIRRAIAADKHPTGVPAAVLAYIRERGLYRRTV